jgi:hypothetical protein
LNITILQRLYSILGALYLTDYVASTTVRYFVSYCVLQLFEISLA